MISVLWWLSPLCVNLKEVTRTRIITVTGLFVIFTLVLSSTGVAYAVSQNDRFGSRVSENSNPFKASPQLPFIVLQDDTPPVVGDPLLYGLYLYGPLLYGVHYNPNEPGGLMWPTYGFVFDKDMVLWVDGTGVGGYVDSVAYVGEWNLATSIFTGRYVNYRHDPYWHGAGSVKMWPYGMTPAEERSDGPNPWIAQSRGAFCYKDSFGCVWDLDLAFGLIYYGSVVDLAGKQWPAVGFTTGSEMFLWGNTPAGVQDFIYTGKYDSMEQQYIGAYVCYPGPDHGLVSWWTC